MIKAAGMMLVTGQAGRALFLRRADTGLWAFPGGHIEEGETAEQAAEREVREEIGPTPHSNPKLWTRRIKADGPEEVDFTTFIATVNDEFIPTLDPEHTAWTWASVAAPPEPLHPGCRIALDRLTMDELGVARAMAAGDLVSPQKYGTFYLWSIRITGTGAAYRDAHDEYCWRPGEIYLNDDFLARCAGLPVVFIHPEKKPKLDSEEFHNRIVGTVFVPFMRDDEVWAVCRIYDDATIDVLQSETFSTSPGVVFTEGSGNQTLTLKDGTNLLIEGKPALLDHIALVPAGVWDKGGPPTGVETRNDSTATSSDERLVGMTDEEKAAADKARNDMSAKLDAIMSKLDSAHSRLDAMEAEDTARKDAEEKEREDRSRRDSARKDKFGKRHDGESFKDYKARHDADEMAMCDAMEKEGAEKDRARKDASDARRDAEDEERRNDETFEQWAKEEEGEGAHKDKARKDAEEKERMEREEKDRKDAALATENAALRKRLDAMEARFIPVSAEDRNTLALAQSRADSIAGLWGKRASPPTPGETPLEYRRRLAADFKQHSARFKDSRFDGMDAATFSTIEDIVYQDATSAARSPDRGANTGMLIPIVSRENGRDVTRFTGDIMSWMAPFMTPGSVGRVIRNPNQGV